MQELAKVIIMSEQDLADLNGPNVGILSDVLVLVKSIFGGFSFFQVDREFDEKEHNRLKGGNRTIAGSLGCDMFV